MQDVVFWEAAVDKNNWDVKDSFLCPNCMATLCKKSMNRLYETKFDIAIGKNIRIAKQIPVLLT
jgi:hypothetical protein